MPGFDSCTRCGSTDDVQEPTADLHVNFAGVRPSIKLCGDCRREFCDWMNEDSGFEAFADGGRETESIVFSEEMEEAGDSLESEVVERFGADDDDVKIEAEEGRGLVTLKARWTA